METKKHKVLFVLGGPGSGKGTQCENMVKTYGFNHFSTGDLLRAEIAKGTELGNEINSYVSQGQLVPGETTALMLKNTILESSLENTTLIDGYPRNQSNIDCWAKVIKNEIEVIGCLYLDCSEETMKNRILNRGQGRADDNEEVFAKRITVFHKETVPITSHFEQDNKLFRVSAEGTKEQCFEEIQALIKKLGLHNEKKIAEMRNYITQNIDPFVKPLIVYLMKTKPESVHSAIKEWIDKEGLEIRNQMEAVKEQQKKP